MFILAFISAAVVARGMETEVDENSIYLLENIQKYEEHINEIKLKVQNLKTDIEKEKELNKTVAKPGYFDEIIKMNAEIEELKNYNGFTDVRGPGIMIRVSDSVSEDTSIDIMDKIVHDVDITILLNDLKNAGAEAIVVNGKRIINISEVVCAGPLLKINGDGVSAPFIICAIGDQDSLYNAVNNEGTYGYQLKNQWGMEVATMKSYNIVIPKFFGDKYDIKYAETK